jgi:competence protein ComFB
MKIRNYQEDIVLHVLCIMLEDYPELKKDEVFITDVAAYVLNRVQPKYIMSERGFTRLALSHMIEEDIEPDLSDLVELIGLINRAIDLVRKRRKSVMGSTSKDGHATPYPFMNGMEYVHNFPQFIGRVLDASTRNPVYNACVTQYIDGLKAVPAEQGWLNPYFTNTSTSGVYSFWPKAVKDTLEAKQSVVKVSVEHKDYKKICLEKTINTRGAFLILNYINGESIVNMETCYLEPR